MFLAKDVLPTCETAESLILMELSRTFAAVGAISFVLCGTLAFLFHFVKKRMSAYGRRAASSSTVRLGGAESRSMEK